MANILSNIFKTITTNMVHGRNEKHGPTEVKNDNYQVRRSLQTKDKSVATSYAFVNPSYSGCDMVATINMTTYSGKTFTATLGELQTLSYSVHNEKAPVRNLGNVNAKDYVTGPVTIAGSLVFAVFHQHWLENLLDKINEVGQMKDRDYVTDAIPPFDIVCSMQSELGFESYLVITGVRIMNEGQVMSTNDIYIENTYQYVATGIRLLKSSYKPVIWESDKTPKLVSTKDPTVLANKPLFKTDKNKDETDKSSKKPIDLDKAFPIIPIVNEMIKK